MTSLFGLQVVVSEHATTAPDAGEIGRRIVRHGMAEILEWLGEDVGPAIEEPVPASFIIGDSIAFMHPSIANQIRRNVSLPGDVNVSLPNDTNHPERVTPR